MSRIKRILSSTCLAASLLIAVAGSGCAGRVRVYDEYHSDYHHWDHNEDVVYRTIGTSATNRTVTTTN